MSEVKEFQFIILITNSIIQGYELELLDGEVINMYGAVVCLVGDIPASNFVGGFKEGVGFALRKCRACLAVQSDISTKVQLL